MGAIKKLAVKAARKAIENSPVIFATVAIGCALGSAYNFVKATLKSREALDEREDQLAELENRFDKDPSIDKEAKKQMRRQVNFSFAKKIARNFIKPVIILIIEIWSIIKCHTKHTQKEALLAGGLNFISDKAERIVEKSEEVVGKKKTDSIRDEVATDKLKEISKGNPKIIETGHGSEIFYHEPTGQLFRSSTAHVLGGINRLDNEFNRGDGDFIDMNWLLLEWGANKANMCEYMGFSSEKFSARGGGHTLFDQTRIVSWDNPDTGEVWKMITHPYEIAADGQHISVPSY